MAAPARRGRTAPPGEGSPVFHTLIDRLTARYPCICELPDEQVEDGVWSDGPLRNNAGPTLTVLGIVGSRVEEVLPFVVQTANALGLVVFDDQEGKVYRPAGAAPVSGSPPPSGPRPWWKFWA